MSQHAALYAGRDEPAPSPSSRGPGRGRGLLDFLPPREKLSFLWRTILSYMSVLAVDRRMFVKCEDKKKDQGQRHTCGFSALKNSGSYRDYLDFMCKYGGLAGFLTT